MRVPLADGTLVATPDLPPDDLIPGFLAASDVLGTGWAVRGSRRRKARPLLRQEPEQGGLEGSRACHR
ncbi:hypothetical protein GCM10020216_105620 [Nonomuraea helvata]